MNDYTPETGDEENEIMDLARERRKTCIDAESKTRSESHDDLRFAKGDQWPENVRKFRETDPTGARPCLTVNKTGKFIRQVVNDSRQNSPAIYVFPVGDGSDKGTARIFNGMIRDCEQRTDAEVAYDTAIESAARIGEGYFRLISRYIEDSPNVNSKNAFEQEIAYQRIRDPFTVHVDPAAIDPAGADAKFAFIDSWMPEKEFKNKYGDAKMAGLDSRGLGEYAPHWIKDGNILVADYYSVEKDQPRTMAMLSNGSLVYLEELAEPPNPDEIVAMRKVSVARCVMRRVSGNSVLEKTIWPCRYIPVFRVIGEEFEVDGDVYYQGLVRPMKDSARMYNYWISTATEKGALETKAPYIGAEGQFEGHESQWKNANRVPFAYLEYKPVDIDGNLAPPPQRNTTSFAGAADVQMAQIASEDMKDTAGVFNAGLGQSGNEKSGRAIYARQRESDTSTFHYIDNLGRAIRHCGRVLVDVLPKYYNKEKIVRIVGEDDTDEMVTINGSKKKEDGALERINDITIGRYDVRVNIGPSYTTRRIESADMMMQFFSAVPQAGQAAGDLLAKAMDWPGADAIAERLKKTLPPELVQEGDEEEAQTFTVEQVQQMIEQANQELAMQFEASIQNRETQVKENDSMIREFDAMTKRLTAIENAAGDTDQIRDLVAQAIAEYLQQSQGNLTIQQ